MASLDRTTVRSFLIAALTLLIGIANVVSLKAASGVANANVALGVKYLNGHGVPKDYTKARHYFQLAAAQHDPLGEHISATCT